MLLIDCISDLHMTWPDLPGGDILIIAGDMTYLGKIEELAKFSQWVNNLINYRDIIVIAGNHDFLFQRKPELAASILGNKVHYLNDSMIEVQGIKIYGSPITPQFGGWAFMKERGQELREHWNKIPEGIDILVTHGPPKGILDECPGLLNSLGVEHVGCQDLLKRVREVKPKYHVFGHIHEGHGRLISGGTTFINCALMDGDYKPVNKYQRIKYDNTVQHS